jgi:hypothetical protein
LPTISGCVFKGNRSLTDGGGLYLSVIDTATVGRSRLPGEDPSLRAPDGIRAITVTACVFDSNYAYGSAGYGGGLCILGPNAVTVRGCTFGRNSAANGGGVGLPDGIVYMENTIIAFNTRGGAVGMNAGGSATLQYSDLSGNTDGDWTGSIADQNGINGNISLDPLLAGAASGDYRLTSGSPCIDTGDPAATPDPDGSRADMGARFFDQSFDLTATVTGGVMNLAWTSSPRAAAYWIYGAVNEPFFAPGLGPGYAHRLAVVGSGTLTWSSSAGVGDPATNWWYLVVAAGQNGLPILPSPRVGEYDRAWDTP